MIQKTEPNSRAYKRDKNKKWKTKIFKLIKKFRLFAR
jgi:hypothetical protein